MNYQQSLKYTRKINNWKATALVCIAIFIFDAFIQKVFAAQIKVDPFVISTSAPIASPEPRDGQFKDVFVFQVVPNIGGSASITNASVSFNVTGIIDNFRAIIDNTFSLSLSQSSSNGIISTLYGTFPTLSSGPNDNHTLQISGIAHNASYGGNINISPVGAVPIPAAVWMFGSALAGLVGIGRRK